MAQISRMKYVTFGHPVNSSNNYGRIIISAYDSKKKMMDAIPHDSKIFQDISFVSMSDKDYMFWQYEVDKKRRYRSIKRMFDGLKEMKTA